VGHGLNLGGGADDLVGVEPSLGLDEVRGKDGVDQGRLAQPRLAYCSTRDTSVAVARWSGADGREQDHLPTQMTLNWNPRLRSLRSIWDVMLSKPTWLWG